MCSPSKFRASFFFIKIYSITIVPNYFPKEISMEINALPAVTLSALIWKQVAISLYLFWEKSLDLMLFPKYLVPSEDTRLTALW